MKTIIVWIVSIVVLVGGIPLAGDTLQRQYNKVKQQGVTLAFDLWDYDARFSVVQYKINDSGWIRVIPRRQGAYTYSIMLMPLKKKDKIALRHCVASMCSSAASIIY